MEKQYNLYNLEPLFRKYLIAGNISSISLKNYMSDFRHFLGWMTLRLKNYSENNKTFSFSKPISIQLNLPEQISAIINEQTIFDYRLYLTSNSLPHKTTNRRLSTIRKFCSFCISQGWMKENPAKKLGNVKETSDNQNIQLKASESHILRENEKKNKPVWEQIKTKIQSKKPALPTTNPFLSSNFGIQHYIGFLILLLFISVIGAGIYNQFFLKQDKSFAYSSIPTRAGRILSFQGRLTDSLGNPINTATNVTFNLYSVATDGSPLYTAGACSITPDSDGIMNVLLGGSGYSPTPPQTVCGTEIPASVFSENQNVYLGITVASDAEMTPRQQIANVGYAINSETLQGLPPGSNASSVPYINSDGNLLIATANPGLRSTYASSTFTVSSALTTVIQSSGAGDVILQATESGSL